MSNIVKVGMADLNTVIAPGILVTLGLGSCVGIALYDTERRIAGLAHIMLPSSKSINNKQNPAKFADTAVETLLNMMIERGADQKVIVAKIAGGAQMFSFKNNNSNLLNIGKRNVIATKEILNKFGIPLLAEDTGGNFGRTIEFHSDTGILVVKTINYGIKKI